MVDQKNGHVHERVRLDKVEVGVVDVCLAVVGAGGQYQPVLLLELVGTDLPMEFGDVEKGAVQCNEYTCLLLTIRSLECQRNVTGLFKNIYMSMELCTPANQSKNVLKLKIEKN